MLLVLWPAFVTPAGAVPADAAQGGQSGPGGFHLAPPADESDPPPKTEAERAQSLLTPFKRERCIPSTGNGIVVCAHNEENDRQKLPVPHEPDSSRQAGDGTPRAPNVHGIADIGGLTTKGCFLPPCPPPPMPIIDVSALPQAPEGSDADRIAKGEIRAP